ncbi:SGNH/GDSL hydrolase family protein [Dokdonella immobilis]|uniref:SGNH/GDSL hydrolase family protein n=1 Tax=Dokdonella immobilis TaxID=578942 RepID=A0A1I4WXY6_9GAMM|nr:SGNH/GDSL hydrolase family protein [Dokdonella immobilis]SFN18285.1 hypothetical protein SAMN05216289_106161 [Dokdonella immobilis]
MRVAWTLLVLALATPAAGWARERIDPPALRVLFVGNSLVYVGNLPAVFDALARRNGRSVHSDMLVKGGATLSDRLEDGSVERALATVKYDHVVLQERGGDFLCTLGADSCKRAAVSLQRLANMARSRDSKPLLLGTYQGSARASRAIVEAESAAATANGIPYVSISNRLQAGIQAAPSVRWLHADHMHPGHQLVLLEAIALYRTLFGESPKNGALRVSAPMHEPDTRFPVAVVRNTFLPDPTARGPRSHIYPATDVRLALAIAGRNPD